MACFRPTNKLAACLSGKLYTLSSTWNGLRYAFPNYYN